MTPIVIGLGTGRCGTKSLATLLGVPHEGKPMPWRFDPTRFSDARAFAHFHGGDVGLYWLNYATAFSKRYPDTRFVCLRRDKEATIRSWMRELYGSDRLACYTTYLNKRTDEFQIQSMMPDFGIEPLETALPRYWDTYYAKAERLAERLPHFRIFEMETALGTEDGRKELLDWCERDGQPNVEVHENKPGQRERAYIKNQVHKIVAANYDRFRNLKSGEQVELMASKELIDSIKTVAELG